MSFVKSRNCHLCQWALACVPSKITNSLKVCLTCKFEGFRHPGLRFTVLVVAGLWFNSRVSVWGWRWHDPTNVPTTCACRNYAASLCCCLVLHTESPIMTRLHEQRPLAKKSPCRAVQSYSLLLSPTSFISSHLHILIPSSAILPRSCPMQTESINDRPSHGRQELNDDILRLAIKSNTVGSCRFASGSPLLYISLFSI